MKKEVRENCVSEAELLSSGTNGKLTMFEGVGTSLQLYGHIMQSKLEWEK